MTPPPDALAGARILVVEDEAPIAEEIRDRLTRIGGNVVDVVDTGLGAVLAAERHRPDVILISIWLKGEMSGIDAAEEISGRIGIPIIFLTTHADWKTIARAKALTPFGYVFKPFSPVDLFTSIQVALHRQGLERRLIESEASLEVTRAFLQRIVDTTPGNIFVMDADGRIDFVNDSLARYLGTTPGALVGRLASEISTDGAEWPHDIVDAAAVVRTGERAEREEEYAATDGSTCWFHTIVVPLTSPDGTRRALGIATDITDLKRAERAAHGRQARLRELFEQASVGIVIMDGQGVYTDANPVACAILGYPREELLGIYGGDLVVDSVATLEDRADAFIETGRHEAEWILRRRDGEHITADVRTTRLANGSIMSFLTDVSERQRTEAMLRESEARRHEIEMQAREAQKMEALGRLAAGVAHDFNNLLTVINGYSDILLASDRFDPEAREQTGEIRAAGGRAASLVNQLLDFSRQSVRQPTKLKLQLLVHEMSRMLERLLGENIAFTTTCASDLRPIVADQTQLEQVLVNLAVNSRDAMPSGGALSIDARNVTIAPDEIPGREAGEYVRIVVHDTGNGMDDATKDRVFEPFFTTKERGAGTGLGLSTVLGIVQQSDGFIDIASEVGAGTRVTIDLPTSSENAGASAESGVALHGRNEGGSILLVEDDDAVRKVTATALQHFGYTVTTAINGRDALRMVTETSDPFDLVMTDVMMPEMDGNEFVKQLRELLPEIRVLFVSGYPGDDVIRRGVAMHEVNFLQKPAPLSELAEAVRSAISEENGRG